MRRCAAVRNRWQAASRVCWGCYRSRRHVWRATNLLVRVGWNRSAFFASLRQADRDRLFAAFHFLAAAARFQLPALHLVHAALDFTRGLLTVFAPAAFLSSTAFLSAAGFFTATAFLASSFTGCGFFTTGGPFSAAAFTAATFALTCHVETS